MARPVFAGGIGAHAALARAARAEAEVVWAAAGGSTLLEDEKDTVEHGDHREFFVERFTEARLRKAHGHDEHSELGFSTDGPASSAVEARWLALGNSSASSCPPAQLADDALRVEARLVAERSGTNRRCESICDKEGSPDWSWLLPAAVDCALGSRSGRAPPVLMRRVADSFRATRECRDICGHAIQEMEGLPASGGQTALAAGPWLGADFAALVASVVEDVREAVRRDFGLQEMPFFAGAVVTRIVPERAGESSGPAGRGPYHAHVDRARVASDDYAAVLYLSSQGDHFEGGGLCFLDEGVDRWLSPRRGRLVTFTAGPENLHRVGHVTGGARFALAMWYTLSAEHAVRTPEPESLEILLQGDATRVFPPRSPKEREVFERIDDAIFEAVD